MSQELRIEVVCHAGINPEVPTASELSLIAAMLPELLMLVQQLNDSDED